MRQSVTASLMRSINRSAILELIRQNDPISRTRIAKELEMSLPTVMRIVDKLIEEDLVRWLIFQAIFSMKPVCPTEIPRKIMCSVSLS